MNVSLEKNGKRIEKIIISPNPSLKKRGNEGRFFRKEGK